MNSVQRLIKYLAIAFAFLLIVGILSSIIECAMSLDKAINKKDNEINFKDLELEDISILDIDIGSTNLIIKEGFLNRNGELIVVPQKNIGNPENLSEGLICIYDELITDGANSFRWKLPEIKIEKRDQIDNRYYPLGEVIVDQKTQKKSIKCFASPVAIILIGKDCINEEK